MRILFSGDSFTWGDELENNTEERFSRLVSQHFDAEEINVSKCGNSNDTILREIVGVSADIVITQWSVPSRYETFLKNQFLSVLPSDATNGPFATSNNTIRNLARQYYAHVQNKVIDHNNLWKNVMMADLLCDKMGALHVTVGLNRHDYMHESTVFHGKRQDLHFICPDIIGEMRDEKTFCPDLMHIDKTKHGNHPNVEGHKRIANYLINQIKILQNNA